MTIADWLIIFVVLTGPLSAILLTRYLDYKKDVKKRKEDIFKTLMATRAHAASWSHVEALNRIDLEFNERDKKEKVVIDAWREYLDFLTLPNVIGEQWESKRVELLVNLLHKMSQFLGYSFDKIQIKNSLYSPVSHSEIEDMQAMLRRYLKDLMEGTRSVPIRVTDNKPQPNQ